MKTMSLAVRLWWTSCVVSAVPNGLFVLLLLNTEWMCSGRETSLQLEAGGDRRTELIHTDLNHFCLNKLKSASHSQCALPSAPPTLLQGQSAVAQPSHRGH